MSSAHSVCTECEMKKSRQFWPVKLCFIPCAKSFALRVFGFLAQVEPLVFLIQSTVVVKHNCGGSSDTKVPCIAAFKWNRGAANRVKSAATI